MSYLAKLKARSEKRQPEQPSKGSKGADIREVPQDPEPSKPSKGAFEGFEGGRSGRFPRIEPDVEDRKADFEERAAILEFEAGMPRQWAEAFAGILCSPPPGDFADQPDRWQAIVDGALRFADQWGAEAHRLGWRVEEVFGLGRIAPAARVDMRGLAWLLADGARVVAIDADGADVVNDRGVASRFYRKGRLQ